MFGHFNLTRNSWSSTDSHHPSLEFDAEQRAAFAESHGAGPPLILQFVFRSRSDQPLPAAITMSRYLSGISSTLAQKRRDTERLEDTIRALELEDRPTTSTRTSSSHKSASVDDMGGSTIAGERSESKEQKENTIDVTATSAPSSISSSRNRQRIADARVEIDKMWINHTSYQYVLTACVMKRGGKYTFLPLVS